MKKLPNLKNVSKDWREIKMAKKSRSINPFQAPLQPWKYWDGVMLNSATYNDYFNRLQNLAISMFKWEGLPESVDERFLELTLAEYGYALYFNDPDMGNLALTCMIGGNLNVYRIPINRRAYSTTGYQKNCTDKDSVLIFNNYGHIPTMMTVALFAKRLYEIERTIDVNIKAQKTPTIILCDPQEELTFRNIFADAQDNKSLDVGVKNLDIDSYKTLNTTAPFVADKLQILKRQVWNEALTFFGIDNVSSEKRERLVSDEVETNLGGVEAQRWVMLDSRQQAAEQINKMFGTNISVHFRNHADRYNGEVNNNGEVYDGARDTDSTELPLEP